MGEKHKLKIEIEVHKRVDDVHGRMDIRESDITFQVTQPHQKSKRLCDKQVMDLMEAIHCSYYHDIYEAEGVE